MELSEAKIPERVMVTARGSVDSLTDTEKASAAKFYRSADKWSIRRAHHVGMFIEGWVVNLNTMRCSCLYFKKFIFCAHIICGRAAYGLNVPGINGNNLKFKDWRVRQKRRPEPAAPLIRPPSTAIYGEMNISTVANASTYTPATDQTNLQFRSESVEWALTEPRPLEHAIHSSYIPPDSQTYGNCTSCRFDQDARGADSDIETLPAPQATERIMFPGRPVDHP
ncbi:unnamed protein product [Phytophthora fragariaefolia]|uniref:Unnamed protein product n=1 Tax=Phytophthora fragariaefolia TaxID=1490495 RepID=A0A9W6YAF0_9STRA|nr:unnamed protein product [Phytophthora fragariaefolia]